LLALSTGAPLTHVPYKGSGPAMGDLVAGHIQMAFSSMAAANNFIKDGKIRGLATSGTTRPPLLASLPTVAEAGIPSFNVLFWTGLFVPAGTPDAIVKTLNEAAKKVLADPKFLASLEKAGEVAGYSSIADSGKFVKAESDRWATVVKEAHITP
jgi:tripartite-type tricarboxylate transporter receptor subunit TctC